MQTTKKTKRQLKELKKSMASVVNVDSSSLLTEYVPLLFQIIMKALEEQDHVLLRYLYKK